MRMARCLSNLILLAYMSITLVNGAVTLSPELMKAIPRCAQSCVSSFIDSNFVPNPCGSTPSLDCLCSHDSLSEYTIGEAAVQCIIGSAQIGVCSPADSTDQISFAANVMCSDKTSALPNTHTVLLATLQFGPTSVGIKPPSTIPATPTSTSTSSSSSSTSSTFTTLTRSASSSISSSPIPTTMNATPVAPVLSTSTQPGRRESSTATPVAPAPVSEDATNLTKAQIAGIAAAAIGGCALTLGLILIFGCIRRRRQRRYRDSDQLPFQMPPKDYPQLRNESQYGNFQQPIIGPGGSSNGVARKIAPPVPARLDTGAPSMFSRRSIQPDQVIGIAISPERGTPISTGGRGESKLLPPKPALKLQMPPKSAESFAQSAPKPMTFNRQSVATQFEEEEEDHANWNNAGWRPQVQNARPSLQGAGLSYPKPTIQQPSSLSRQSTATQFEDVEENGIRRSQIATARGTSYNQPQMPRQSTATQFEEDENVDLRRTTTMKSTTTQFEEDGVTSAVDTAIDMWEKFSPINTTGPPAFYFPSADEQRVQQAARHNGVVAQAKPVTIGRGIGSFSQPRKPSEYPPKLSKDEPGLLDDFPRPPRQVPPTLRIAPNASRSGPASTSSVYTMRTSSLPSNSPRIITPPEGAVPQIPQAYKQMGPYDAPKTGNSMTSYGSSSNLSTGGPRTGDNLSPVVESPSSGRSPVSYPKIPKRLSEDQLRLIPPPSQPRFDTQQGQDQLRRNSSLTSPPQGIDIQLPSQLKRGSTAFAPQSPNWDTYTPTPISPSGPSFSTSNLPFTLKLQPQDIPYKKPIPNSKIPPRLAPGFVSPPRTSSRQMPTVTTPGIQISRTSSLSQISEDANSFHSTSTSTTNSLPKQSQLAQRRRGNEKAAQLAIDSDAKKKWRVLNGVQVNAAKSPQWRPMLSQGNTLSPLSAEFGAKEAGRKQFERMDPVELPGTPGWVPKLTPTRRGDDLFISVG
ncbi:hypothetical protein BJ875DRAFT_497429 [Amylocarpus encephaloides]|uniref:Extracellular membrane protein CFEM domain-containing protein n=1 Tax=Amylocarpus encephaloides TaxID=45428 RepID=A0A9P7YF35_9HELO|nr:hypothetical protein BJ875DRAFT_497429 [Amylocarpus encephaloides]